MTVIKEDDTGAMPNRNTYDALLCGPKILYFFTFLQQYSFYSFRSVFFKAYFKYEPYQTGLIYSLTALSSFIGMTAWSNAADTTKRPKMIYMLVITGSLFTFMPLYFKDFIANSFPEPFYVVLVVLCVYSFFNYGMNPILSNTVLEMLTDARETDKSIYGRQVLFGSIAYIISNFVQGWANDTHGAASVFVIFPVSTELLLLAVFFAFPSDSHRRLRDSEPSEKNTENTAITTTIPTPSTPMKPWWHVLRSARFVLFLTVIFLTGCARSVMSAFLPLFYKDNLDLTSQHSSWLMISGVTLEMLSFAMAPAVSKVGPYWMLVLAQVVMAVRAWAYVKVPVQPSSFPIYMVIELLKGAAFGLTHLAGVRIARETAPEGLEATAQGFYEGFYSQIPSILSVPLGGAAIQKLGFASLFLYSAWGITFSCCLVIAVFIQNGKLRIR